MSFSGRAYDVLDSLRDGGMEAVEVYTKKGRGRRYERDGSRHRIETRQEEGWAVRAGDARCSFFAAGVGIPHPGIAWPDPDGYALTLPPRQASADWRDPEGLDAPLAGEVEARELVAGVERRLREELPGASLERATLDDGSSESSLIASTGIEARWRQRLTVLRVEATWGKARVELERSGRSIAAMQPSKLAQELAVRLLVLGRGEVPPRDRAVMVLAPAVSTALLEALLPLFTDPSLRHKAMGWVDGRGRLATPRLTIVDDGGLAGGLLSAPVDGEGVPTGRSVLLEEGALKGSLSDWRTGASGPAVGTMRRSSWRDLPRVGPSHLLVQPAEEAPRAASLVEGVARGYYLLEATAGPVVDWRDGRFFLPVCGFVLDGGVAQQPIAGVTLHGSVGKLLRGVQAVARDLTFFPRRGQLGAPTLLVGGLELDDSSSPR